MPYEVPERYTYTWAAGPVPARSTGPTGVKSVMLWRRLLPNKRLGKTTTTDNKDVLQRHTIFIFNGSFWRYF